jgi:hypothetical protein
MKSEGMATEETDMFARNTDNAVDFRREVSARTVRSTVGALLRLPTHLILTAVLCLSLAGCPAPVPLVTSVTPEYGPTDGGTEVTILGTGFEVDTGVLFGDQTALEMQCINTGLMRATAPAHGAGVVPLVLIDSAGSSISTGFSFSYEAPEEATRPAAPVIASITPASGPVAGGTPVTIRGSGFAPGIGVLFGDAARSTHVTRFATDRTRVRPASTGHSKSAWRSCEPGT